MSQPPLFPSFDGLMHLAKREGVDIRPTLLRVLTDLYVQAPGHSAEEQQHYVELASRLIVQVDDATRSVVRARLAVYPDTPHEIRELLGLAKPVALPQAVMNAEPRRRPSRSKARRRQRIAAGRSCRCSRTMPRRSTRCSWAPHPPSASRSCAISKPRRCARRRGSNPFAPVAPWPCSNARRSPAISPPSPPSFRMRCCCRHRSANASSPTQAAKRSPAPPRRWRCPADIFQRVLLFLKPEWGSSVIRVFRLARLYDTLSEQAALIMLSVWRGAIIAQTKAKYRPALYDDERRRARPAAAAPQPASSAAKPLPGRMASAEASSSRDRESAVRRGPRSRRSRCRNRSGFPW